jgi:hypothetical protein
MLTTTQLAQYSRLLPKGAKVQIARECGVSPSLVSMVLCGARSGGTNHEAICKAIVAYMEKVRTDTAAIEGTFEVKP